MSKTFQSSALPGFPTQTQILTETLFKSDQSHLTCETRNRPSFEINQPPRVLIMTVGPFKSCSPRRPEGGDRAVDAQPESTCGRRLPPRQRVFAQQRLISRKRPGKLCRPQPMSHTPAHVESMAWRQKHFSEMTDFL